MFRAVAVGVIAVCLVGCGRLSPPPPTLIPTAVPSPTLAVTAVPTVDANAFDVQDAFLSNVNDLTDEVEALATASCDDLTTETQDNPTEVPEIHGFATTLQRAATNQAVLNSDDVRTALADLNKAVTQLDAALNTCGIKSQ
jgi:hypothetical protein